MIYCKNCGNQMDDIAAICVKCGVKKGDGFNFCQNCGQPTAVGMQFCTSCGAALNNVVPGAEQKSRIAAGILGVILGSIGIHNFYLGNNSRGVLQIVLTAVTCGAAGLWGFIEGIMILCGSIKTDANGVPLKD